MDTSALPHRKPPLRKKAHPDAALDRSESARVRYRSGGQCEVVELVFYSETDFAYVRCPRMAEHVMHLIDGNGRRGIGLSALHQYKLHGCAQCHRDIDGDIGGKKLIRLGGTLPLWNDPYRRVR